MINNLCDLIVIHFFPYYQCLGVLKLFLRFIVLDLFVVDALVCYFYIDVENRVNGYYFFEVTGNNFYICCYNLSFGFVNYFVIDFDSCHLISGSLIYCMNYFVIDCLDNFDFHYLSNFYFYFLNSFYFCCMMSFVICHWKSVYSLSLIGNLIEQIVLCLNLIVDSYFDYWIGYMFCEKFREFLCSGDLPLYLELYGD